MINILLCFRSVGNDSVSGGSTGVSVGHHAAGHGGPGGVSVGGGWPETSSPGHSGSPGA